MTETTAFITNIEDVCEKELVIDQTNVTHNRVKIPCERIGVHSEHRCTLFDKDNQAIVIIWHQSPFN